MPMTYFSFHSVQQLFTQTFILQELLRGCTIFGESWRLRLLKGAVRGRLLSFGGIDGFEFRWTAEISDCSIADFADKMAGLGEFITGKYKKTFLRNSSNIVLVTWVCVTYEYGTSSLVLCYKKIENFKMVLLRFIQLFYNLRTNLKPISAGYEN